MPGTQAAAEQTPVPKATLAVRTRGWRSLLRAVICGCGSGLILVTAGETANVFVGHNFHVVIPGRIYRCAQQSGPGLEQVVQGHGIRTVVNLRGCCAPSPWYLEECRATQHLDIAQEDICLSSSRLPSVPEVRRLLEVLDHAEYPILLHCRRGADRTGLAAAVVLLLQTDVSPSEARRQLAPRYGHLPLGHPAFLDKFFDLYADWLKAQGLTHTRETFRRWAEREYCPGPCRCKVEPLEVPASVPRGKPLALRVRVHNTSVETWHLRSGTNAGIHLGFVLTDANDRVVATGRSGLFDAEVPPDQSIDLTLAIPALNGSGPHHLFVDMIDEQQCWFFQTGSEPLEVVMNDE